MMVEVLAIAYLIGWIATARTVALAMIREDRKARERIGAMDRAMSGFLGMLAGAFWPMILIGLLLTREPKEAGRGEG